MGLTYFKRYRMEVDLPRGGPAAGANGAADWNASEAFALQPPPGYVLLPWNRSLLEAHADVKYQSFRAEIDASVFPCLGTYAGCLRLMDEISRKPRFLPDATWLAVYLEADGQRRPCGTIQGLLDPTGFGAVQNLGIIEGHRGRGLGSVLLAWALEGFRQAGLDRAYLEVTAQNEGAVRLYHRFGFRKARTAYKAVEAAACG